LLYSLIRPLLFRLDPEHVHDLSLALLAKAKRMGILPTKRYAAAKPTQVMGLNFPNCVGLAAGLDKNGAFVDALATLGFGFIEIGTTTPRSQPGNAKPRMFRLTEQEAIINRMGFNNTGVAQLIANVTQSRYRGILGINIGKNADTPIERATDDYLACLTQVYSYASYVTVNISSPNTKNLRQLQQETELDALLSALKIEQRRLQGRHGKYVPLAIKIAPDLSESDIDMIADRLLAHELDAVIATNTTLARVGIEQSPYSREAGGLSGKPLRLTSTGVVRRLAKQLGGRIPIIGVGGVADAASAREKLDAGASLIQIYSALIYRGPQLVGDIVNHL
jgi:dihydroorotate dehydrogenase